MGDNRVRITGDGMKPRTRECPQPHDEHYERARLDYLAMCARSEMRARKRAEREKCSKCGGSGKRTCYTEIDCCPVILESGCSACHGTGRIKVKASKRKVK